MYHAISSPQEFQGKRYQFEVIVNIEFNTISNNYDFDIVNIQCQHETLGLMSAKLLALDVALIEQVKAAINLDLVLSADKYYHENQLDYKLAWSMK